MAPACEYIIMARAAKGERLLRNTGLDSRKGASIQDESNVKLKCWID